ncbi:hypothetical protein BWI17_15520 [Betaproteobacteria bacterium GR16-43]|nr:hypothetical protein BWI17_15520 [Betaproteobacteria bacterium GR16-43]
MNRLLSSLLLLLTPLQALAAEEAPVEHASQATVVVFLVLFLGGIVGYGIYLWWRARGAKHSAEK